MFRTLLFLAVVALAAWAAYRYYESSNKGPNQLGKFVEEHAETIYGPLSVGSMEAQVEPLREIRDHLKKRGEKAGQQDARTEAGIAVCNELKLAIDAREDQLKRLSSARNHSYTSSRSAKDRDEDLEKKKGFFSQGIEQDWQKRAESMRRKFAQKYSRFRSLSLP